MALNMHLVTHGLLNMLSTVSAYDLCLSSMPCARSMGTSVQNLGDSEASWKE